MQKIIAIIICLTIGHTLTAQVNASVTKGCIPLEVQFDGPALANYYWVFGDGGGPSDDTSPSRIYTDAGIYTVELFDSEGGTSQGTVEITVYADPIIMFSVVDDETFGCAPFSVSFVNKSIVDAAVPITGYKWVFGDGTTSTDENPTHIYSGEGVFPVTLEIFSSLPECGNIMTFEDVITVSGSVQSGFSVNTVEICDAPATFTIANTTPDEPAYSYEWIFGDGSTSTDRDPGTHTYNNNGTYTLQLIVDNGDGCKVTIERDLRVGGPDIILGIPDTICINKVTPFFNQTAASEFSWTIGGGGFPSSSTEREPNVQFFDSGIKLITLTTTSLTGCMSDTTFSVYVQEIDGGFTPDPFITCSDPATFVFTANEPNHASYTWTPFDPESPVGVTSGTPNGVNYTVQYMDNQNWDSFHINRPDTIFYQLSTISYAGCVSVDIGYAIFRDIEAHPVPNRTRGCAPLTVNFANESESFEPIIRNDWDFGDGSAEVNDPSGSDQSHTYTEPGEYYVKMIVENDNGCIDTSTGIWIYVGEPLTSDVTIDKTAICLFDTISMEALNLDPRIDAWHFETDEGRNGHCYESPLTEHAFVTKPGTFPLTLEIEYNGCFNKEEVGSIEVSGAKALIQYMTNCDDPYTVMFQDSSFGATHTVWTIEDQTFETGNLTDSILNYTFNDTGIYTVYLEAFDAGSTCPSNIDSVEVHIVDIHASFVVDSIHCAGDIFFDASSSVGVDDRCHKGYTWYFPVNRPRRIGLPTITQGFGSGPEPDNEWSIRLEVEDINGCVDDTTINIKVLNIKADFEFDRDTLCFPSELTTTDLSVSDTTIVSWTWSTTSDSDSIVTFTALGEAVEDVQYTVSLEVQNAIGCKDSITYGIDTYEISSEISVTPVVCLGDTVFLSATDYTQDGSFLYYDWNTAGTQTDLQSFSVVPEQSGNYTVNLRITEDATGCEADETSEFAVVAYPIADFAVDGLSDTVCIGNAVAFTNLSTSESPVDYAWSFGNGTFSTVENPETAYPDRGTFDVEMTVTTTSGGCADTATGQVTTVGPQGDFMIDNNMICQSGSVTFTLVDPEGVSSFEWDFGDGTTVENENPHTHEYSLSGTSSEIINAKLILRGDIMACEIIKDIEIQISNIDVAFSYEVDSTTCPYSLRLASQSVDELFEETITVELSTSSETQTFESLPDVITFEELGTATITRKVQLAGTNCTETEIATYEIGIPELLTSFVYVLDTTTCPYSLNLESQSNHGGLDEEVTVILSPSNKTQTFESLPDVIFFDELGSATITRKIIDEIALCNIENDNIHEIETPSLTNRFELIKSEDHDCELTYMVTSEVSTAASPVDITYTNNLDGPVNILDDLITVQPGVEVIFQNVSIGEFEFCNSTVSDTVEFYELGIPNLFTPNNDGNNEYFAVARYGDQESKYDECIGICSFQVFDRWGTEVFVTNSNVGWDGTIDGKDAPAEVYVYLVTAYYKEDSTDDTDCAMKEIITFKGNVLLAR